VVATVTQFMLGHLVFALMLSIGLAARPRDLRDIRARPALYVRALLVSWLAVPVLAMVVVKLFGLHQLPSELMLLIAVCPGAPFIPAATKHQGQTHSPLGLNLLILTSLSAVLLTPAWVRVLEDMYHFGIAISAKQVAVRTLTTVIIPLCLGFATRYALPRIADALVKPVHTFFLAALLVAVCAGLYLGAPVFLQVTLRVVVASAAIVVGAVLLGSWSARSEEATEARTVGVAAALGNPGLALAVIAVSHPGFKAAAFVVAYVIFRKLVLIPFEQLFRRHERRAEQDADSTRGTPHRHHHAHARGI
jgi:bile acid:Na+ symporter, BASS family